MSENDKLKARKPKKIVNTSENNLQRNKVLIIFKYLTFKYIETIKPYFLWKTKLLKFSLL